MRSKSSKPPRENKQKNATHQSIPKSWRMITGQHAVRECLKVRPTSVKQVYIQNNWQSRQDLKEFESILRFKTKVEIQEIPQSTLDRMASSNQGIILYANEKPEVDLNRLKTKNKSIVVVLDGIEDPHNLGAILRSSWLFGVDAVIISSERSVGMTATVHKVASGGAEHVPVLEVNQFAPTLTELKEAGFWIFGLSLKAKSNLFNIKYPEKIIWVIGAEDKGMRITTERQCDELVKLPQSPSAERAGASFNASVATAFALTETYRQQLL